MTTEVAIAAHANVTPSREFLERQAFEAFKAFVFAFQRLVEVPGRRRHNRHSFGTHAALFGVNPWRLQSWMGHKRIDETMIYVHVAENHRREIPACVLEAGLGESDPDRRILGMLAARGKNLAKTEAPKTKEAAEAAS